MKITTLNQAFDLIQNQLLLDLINPQVWQLVNNQYQLQFDTINNWCKHNAIEIHSPLLDQIKTENLHNPSDLFWHLLNQPILINTTDGKIISELQNSIPHLIDYHQQAQITIKQCLKINPKITNINTSLEKLKTTSLLHPVDQDFNKSINQVVKTYQKLTKDLINFQTTMETQIYLISNRLKKSRQDGNRFSEFIKCFGKAPELISNLDQYLTHFQTHLETGDLLPRWWLEYLEAIKKHRFNNLSWPIKEFFTTKYHFDNKIKQMLEQFISANESKWAQHLDVQTFKQQFNLHQQVLLTFVLNLEDHLEQIDQLYDDQCELESDLENIFFLTDDNNFSDYYKKWTELDYCENTSELEEALEALKSKYDVKQQDLLKQTIQLLKAQFSTKVVAKNQSFKK